MCVLSVCICGKVCGCDTLNTRSYKEGKKYVRGKKNMLRKPIDCLYLFYHMHQHCYPKTEVLSV